MSFARPFLLLLLLALPAWWWYRRRARVTVPFSDVRMAGKAGKPPWWIHLPPILRSLALGAFILAAAGPQVGGSTVEEKRRNQNERPGTQQSPALDCSKAAGGLTATREE